MNKILSGKNSHLLVALIVLILTLKIAAVLFVLDIDKLSDSLQDCQTYMRHARAYLGDDSQTLRYDLFFVGPVVIWLFSFYLLVFNGNWTLIFLLNAILTVFLSVLIAWFCNILFKNRFITIAAFLWSSIYIIFLRTIPTGGKDLWITVLLFSVVLIFARLFVEKPKIKLIIYSVIIYAVLIHLDERYIALLPVFFTAFFLLPNIRFQEKLKYSIIFSITVFLLMVPWTIRNFYEYGKIVIVSERTSHIVDRVLGQYDEDAWYFEEFFLDSKNLSEEDIEMVIAGRKTYFDSGKIIRDVQIEAMKKGHIPYQYNTFEKYYTRFINYWRAFDFKGYYSLNGWSYNRWSLRHNLAIILSYGVLLPFFIYGFLHFFTKNRNLTVFMFLLVFTHVLIHVLFIPYTRYRYRTPIDPITISFAWYGIYTVFHRLKSFFVLSR